jgi:hypothetical protein
MQRDVEPSYFEPKVESVRGTTKGVGSESLTERDYLPFKPESVTKIIATPNKTTYSTLTYESGDPAGDELRPSKRILYRIPVEFQGRLVRDVILKHRKDPARFSGDGWDPNGAYSRVLIRDSTTKEWKSWVDPAGNKSDKFSEPRPASNPENEVLHDWIATVGKVKPLLISVENVGRTDRAISNIHGIEVIFFPEGEGVSYQEQIFSAGTSFIDLDKRLNEPHYGGGPSYQGRYPNAVALGGWGHTEKNPIIGNDPNKQFHLDSQGRLHIKLMPGKKFVNLELAVGDTHPDGKPNKDGHVGTLGWAKIYAELKAGDSTGEQYFMRNVNVPPVGVLAGGPEQTDRVITEGDEIIIESRSDTSFLMGYRIAYK